MSTQTISKEKKIKSLPVVLAYQNDDIVYKFMENFDVSFEESTMLFNETKKWLWMCAITKMRQNKGEEVPVLTIDEPLIMLDEMWHTFVLFTKAYGQFCKEYFGFFIHHSPTTKREKDLFRKRMEENPQAARKEIVDRSETQLNYIYDMLGEETLKIWYSSFPDKYSRKQLDRMRKLSIPFAD